LFSDSAGGPGTAQQGRQPVRKVFTRPSSFSFLLLCPRCRRPTEPTEALGAPGAWLRLPCHLEMDCVFYSEFDNEAGPVLRYQAPRG
jgi:hypothetical protein